MTISVIVQTGCAPTEGRGVVTYEVTNQPTNHQPARLNAYIQLFILLPLCPNLKPLCTFIIKLLGAFHVDQREAINISHHILFTLSHLADFMQGLESSQPPHMTMAIL